MAAGLPIVVASSEVWPENASMGQRALNSGWTLDQRFDGAGGFITNTSPTSSGKIFQSTGDATPLYVIGRTFKARQAAGDVVGTVGQSSASGGITTIYINQFSTAAGLSTTMSTGVITSVAVGPDFPRSTDFNFFGYGMQPIASTGGSGGAAFGTTAFASSGLIRLSQSGIGIVGKTSTGGDDVAWPIQFLSTTLTGGQIASSGVNGTNVFNKTLSVGTWLIESGVTVNDTGAGSFAQVRITDGTNFFSIAQINSNVASFFASSAAGLTLCVQAIVNHSTALAYQVQIVSSSTTVKAQDISPAFGTTGASWFRAIKLGSS